MNKIKLTKLIEEMIIDVKKVFLSIKVEEHLKRAEAMVETTNINAERKERKNDCKEKHANKIFFSFMGRWGFFCSRF